MKEEEYNALVDMFESDGWKVFTTTLSEVYEGTLQSAPSAAETGDQWQILRGQLSQIQSILGYENFIKLSYEAQQEDNNG